MQTASNIKHELEEKSFRKFFYRSHVVGLIGLVGGTIVGIVMRLYFFNH